jgi:DNA invertase Pin-like site-specific DNA recombinase
VKAGSISTILVYRLDRFTRRVKDLHKMLELLEKHHCAFKSATEPYDTSTAMGKLFITIVAALAEWETDNLSERVKMALEEKVQSGERVGNIPYGFDLSEDEKLIKNGKQAPVVLNMIDKFKSGMSAHALADYLNQTNNDRTWYAKGVIRILSNPALYGSTRWNDKIIENTHEGFISKHEFLKIQQMLNDRSLHHNREVKGTYIFQGVLVCPECGNKLTVNRFLRKNKDGSDRVGVCYKCRWCYKEGRKMLTIGEYRFIEALYEYMKHVEIKNIEPVKVKDEQAILLDQLKQIEKKREKYQKGWAADLISDEEFEKLMLETKNIYDDLKNKLAEYKAPVQIGTEALKKIIFTFNKDFSLLPHEKKRMFISQFIRKIEFKIIDQPPKNKRNKKGKSLVVISNVEFY